VFDHTYQPGLHGDRPENAELAAQVSEAWLAFARTGDPNHPGLPTWPAYDTTRRATMLFDTTCRVVEDPDGDERKAWVAAAG